MFSSCRLLVRNSGLCLERWMSIARKDRNNVHCTCTDAPQRTCFLGGRCTGKSFAVALSPGICGKWHPRTVARVELKNRDVRLSITSTGRKCVWQTRFWGLSWVDTRISGYFKARKTREKETCDILLLSILAFKLYRKQVYSK